MGVRYGTIDGVKKKAKTFDQDFALNDPVVNTEIELYLDQASNYARDILQTRYNLATIDSNAPDAVIELTEIVAAIFLLSSWGSMINDGSQTGELLKWLKKREMHYLNLIWNGNILDSSNTPLATNQTVSVYTSPVSNTLGDIYS